MNLELVASSTDNAPLRLTSPIDTTLELLTSVLTRLRAGESAPEATHALVTGLQRIRSTSSEGEWHRSVRACRAHPLNQLLLEDPFTRRSVTKPRGYAGDAEMLDYIYSGLGAEEASKTSDIGRRIFGYTAGQSASARAVRQRRDILADAINTTVSRKGSSRVLAVACGHLRELALASDASGLREVVALDQDEVSLRRVEASYDKSVVSTVRATVKDIVTGRVSLRGFDLAYAAGLYDYLETPVAQKLTERLFDALEPGGRLLIGNFAAGFQTSAYMDAFMDWRLLGRSPSDMLALMSGIDPARVETCSTFHCSTGFIVYLDVCRTEVLAMPGQRP